MATSHSDLLFEEELLRLQGGAAEARFSEMGLNATEIKQICDAIIKNPKLKEISFSHTVIGDTGAAMLADAIRNHPGLREINLANAQVGDAGMAAIASASLSLPQLSLLTLAGNPFGDPGAEAIANLLTHGAPQLNYLYMDRAQFSEKGRQELEHAILGTPKRNLVYTAGMGNAVQKFVSENGQSAISYRYVVQGTLRRLKPEFYCDLAEQESAIHLFIRQEKGGVIADKQIQHYRDFIQTIPSFDLSQDFTMDDLLKPFGWDGSDWEMRPVDNPRLWEGFSHVMARLHEQGIALQGAELLGEDGKPNALLEMVMARGKTKDLFTQDNWAGGSVHDLHRVLNALPEATQEQITNRHALASSISRAQRGQAR